MCTLVIVVVVGCSLGTRPFARTTNLPATACNVNRGGVVVCVCVVFLYTLEEEEGSGHHLTFKLSPGPNVDVTNPKR